MELGVKGEIAIPSAQMLEQVPQSNGAQEGVGRTPGRRGKVQQVRELRGQVQLSILNKPQNRDRGDRLGKARDAEQGARFHRQILTVVTECVASSENQFAVACQREGSSGNVAGLHERTHRAIEAGQYQRLGTCHGPLPGSTPG